MVNNLSINKTEGASKYVTPSMKIVQTRVDSSIMVTSIDEGPEKYEQNSWDLDGDANAD